MSDAVSSQPAGGLPKSASHTTRETAEQVLVLSGLKKIFRGHLGIGRTVAVDGLDLEVRRGEIFGVLGPNGAGKTTTFKMVLGLTRPDEGTVELFGRPPSDVRARARIGYLPENPYFYDHLTALEFLDFYARLHGIPRAERKRRTRDTLRLVGLDGRGEIPMRKFSKGMVQRVGLAQAIQHDPELVILDEPMSGLDPLGRREVRDLILALRDAGRTVVFSSHVLQDAEMICDRVAILKNGRLRSIGRLDELISRRVEWYEVALRTTDPGRLPARPIASDVGHCLMRVDDLEGLTDLLVAAKKGGAEVLSVWPKRETLEDLFLRTVDEPEGSEGRG
jgi:ABC-2 type transport system ATP-binding protein